MEVNVGERWVHKSKYYLFYIAIIEKIEEKRILYKFSFVKNENGFIYPTTFGEMRSMEHNRFHEDFEPLCSVFGKINNQEKIAYIQLLDNQVESI